MTKYTEEQLRAAIEEGLSMPDNSSISVNLDKLKELLVEIVIETKAQVINDCIRLIELSQNNEEAITQIRALK